MNNPTEDDIRTAWRQIYTLIDDLEKQGVPLEAVAYALGAITAGASPGAAAFQHLGAADQVLAEAKEES